jgi:Tfp pilus assembly protein FimT
MQPREAGATLLELVMCLGILGILVGLTLVGFGRVVEDRRVEAVAWEIAGKLRWAQGLAMARAADWWGVRVRITDRVEVRGVRRDGLETEVIGVSDGFPDGVRVRPLGQRPVIEFAASGAPVPGSNQTIEVRSGASARYVVIAPQTGRVRISPTPP